MPRCLDRALLCFGQVTTGRLVLDSVGNHTILVVDPNDLFAPNCHVQTVLIIELALGVLALDATLRHATFSGG